MSDPLMSAAEVRDAHGIELLACPFCGEAPTMERWHGGGPERRMIACEGLYCDVAPQVTGETPQEAAERWNTRAGGAS